ncbi:pentatricopeptide repeat-containing protein At4g21065-like [Vitis vinifera]|nr:pentatricopeptide repeat-containing protein At4g21065-like [Vitis vinifera]XP_019075101.1 pentatricopeptide repeat-containing protein At4g21065-like [Vitis vinifera]|eukprot:XP_010648655.1 PREDICTED: pentatricopeptide repeat-containing protein At4g21065-like [Vitis vinifera]
MQMPPSGQEESRCAFSKMRFSYLKPRLLHSINTSKLKTTTLHHQSNMNHRAVEQPCLDILQACNTLPKLAQLHTHIIKLGFQNNPLVLTKFTSASSNLDAIPYAMSLVFSVEDARVYDAFLFSTIIRAYAESSQSKHNAIFYYNLMLGYGISPNKYAFPFVLKACAGLRDLNLGKAVHGSLVKFGFDDDIFVQNTMVHMYCCCSGGMEFARKLFDEMPKLDPVTWTAMIGGYARLGQSAGAVGLFRKMQIAGVCPDDVTMVSVLSACTDLGALELGKWIESYIEKERVLKTVELSNALVDMFAKCGDVDKALGLFRNMSKRTIVSWTSVIVGLAMHGRGLEAVSLFEEMKASGMVPEDIAFIGLLSACSHSGLVERGRQYFSEMTRQFGIVPKIEHYGCMVDLLSRAGLVTEALEFVERMPIEPNPIIWRTLISACRVHGELKLGESISKQLIRNEPMHESNYVLLSNIYGKMLDWEKKSKIRVAMGKKGIQKVPGSTMIELDNEIHEFIVGDRSHNQYNEIIKMVNEMGREMKRAGYAPTTTEVFLDIDEEDKEDALSRHSEKLAIAFALLNTPPGSPIRITKNLRVCGDCHSASKFISKIYNREIVMRDRSRFHHFRDGQCSCGDFW